MIVSLKIVCSIKLVKWLPGNEHTGESWLFVVNTPESLDIPMVNTPRGLDSHVLNTQIVNFLFVLVYMGKASEQAYKKSSGDNWTRE
jgi:hypothetical protein